MSKKSILDNYECEGQIDLFSSESLKAIDDKPVRNKEQLDETAKMVENAENKSYKMQIADCIAGMSGKYSAYEIFSNWVMMMAIAIQNGCTLVHDNVWKQREQQYIQAISRYSPQERETIIKMTGLLVLAFEEETADVLGEIYMESGCGSKTTGQFFTPFNISQMCAGMAIPEDVNEDNKYILNEPSAGGGGMIIAAARVLKKRGLNYQKCMVVTAQDMDWKAVYMTYVQVSLLGIDAIIVQGDTLTEPYRPGYPEERVFYTPKRMGALL